MAKDTIKKILVELSTKTAEIVLSYFDGKWHYEYLLEEGELFDSGEKVFNGPLEAVKALRKMILKIEPEQYEELDFMEEE